ncbi:hypothetical protein KEJ21_01590 [Candidatus Bathyarchaeota archaeon]|nr:hypothetical protein [Candidatus Bathyarchaeota archaeon]
MNSTILREEALRTVQEIKDTISTIKKLESEIEVIENLILELDEGKKLNEDYLNSLGLSPLPKIVLKLRLKGLETAKKSSVIEQKSKLKTKKGILEDLIKCPTCNGMGNITERTYDRSDGRITQIIKTNICIECKGTGKSELSDYIMDLIKLLDLKLF